LAKVLLPNQPTWEIGALLVLGLSRYGVQRCIGLVSPIAGYVVYDPIAGLLLGLLTMASLTLWRQTQQVTWAVLILMPLITAFRAPQATSLILLMATLSGLVFWTEYPAGTSRPAASSTLRLFRADSLDDRLSVAQAGYLAASLARAKRLGLSVPQGWVVYPGDDPTSLLATVTPTPQQPWQARPSPRQPGISAGITGITHPNQLWGAIVQCFEASVGTDGSSSAVLVQPEVPEIARGVADRQSLPYLTLSPRVAQGLQQIITTLDAAFGDPQQVEWVDDGERVWIVGIARANPRPLQSG
jgi:pyruvate,water dikinase